MLGPPSHGSGELSLARVEGVGGLLCFAEIHAGRCYCHRHLAARRLEDTLGMAVPGFGHPELDRLLTARFASSRPVQQVLIPGHSLHARAHARVGLRKIVAYLKVGAGPRPELHFRRKAFKEDRSTRTT
jgi:hypothetical protein